jgi:curved DNA-binding protein CbpA
MTRAEDLAVLEVSEGVSPKEIRQKYKKLARRDHPDKGGSKEAFQRLSDAYERLSQPREESSGSEAYEPHGPAGGSYRDDGQDDFTSNFWYHHYYHFFQRRWNSRYDGDDADDDDDADHGSDGDDDDDDDDHFDHWHEATRKAYARERQENLKRGYDYRDYDVSEEGDTCMFCGLHAPIIKELAEASGLNWKEYTAHPDGYKTCWDCKNNHVSVMSKSMALKKFAKKLDFTFESARTGREYNPVFFFLKLDGKSFHHQPVTKFTDGPTRNTEYFWYPDLEDRALAEGWKPRGKKKDEVPWVRKDEPVSCERVVVAKKQMPTKRKRNTNSSAPETPRKFVRKVAAVSPEKEAKPRR